MPYKVQFNGKEGQKFSFPNPDNPSEKVSLAAGESREFEKEPEIGEHPYVKVSGKGKPIPAPEPETEEMSEEAPKEEKPKKKKGKKKKKDKSIGEDRIG